MSNRRIGKAVAAVMAFGLIKYAAGQSPIGGSRPFQPVTS